MMSHAPQLFETYDYNAPLSPECIQWLQKNIKQRENVHVVDFGCGWGELLSEIVLHLPESTGSGYDIDPFLIERANARTARCSLGGRIAYSVADCTQIEEPCDVLVCMGSTHAWARLEDALSAFELTLRPEGQLILGVPQWEKHPTDEACHALGTPPDGLPNENGLRTLIGESGFDITGFRASTLAEWDAFEIAWCASRVLWLRANENHPDFAKYKEQLEQHRTMWLDGYRTYLGFSVIVATKRSQLSIVG